MDKQKEENDSDPKITILNNLMCIFSNMYVCTCMYIYGYIFWEIIFGGM